MKLKQTRQTAQTAVMALAGVGLFSAAPRAQAKDVFTTSLEPATTGGIHASSELKLTLAAEKPAGITLEPRYRYTPQYGTITLGNAKNNKIVVVLDTDGATARPKLYVDANGNGDLTDDPPIVLSAPKVPLSPVIWRRARGQRDADCELDGDCSGRRALRRCRAGWHGSQRLVLQPAWYGTHLQ